MRIQSSWAYNAQSLLQNTKCVCSSLVVKIVSLDYLFFYVCFPPVHFCNALRSVGLPFGDETKHFSIASKLNGQSVPIGFFCGSEAARLVLNSLQVQKEIKRDSFAMQESVCVLS